MPRPEAQAVCGSVDDVVADLERRIRATGGIELLMVQMDQGALPPDEVVDAVTRFATEVLPRLRETPCMTAGWASAATSVDR